MSLTITFNLVDYISVVQPHYASTFTDRIVVHRVYTKSPCGNTKTYCTQFEDKNISGSII